MLFKGWLLSWIVPVGLMVTLASPETMYNPIVWGVIVFVQVKAGIIMWIIRAIYRYEKQKIEARQAEIEMRAETRRIRELLESQNGAYPYSSNLVRALPGESVSDTIRRTSH